jgi:hypothetical protein
VRIAFGADDENECVRAVLTHLRSVADEDEAADIDAIRPL